MRIIIKVHICHIFQKSPPNLEDNKEEEFLSVSIWYICSIQVVFAVRLEFELSCSQLVLQLEKVPTWRVCVLIRETTSKNK